MDRRGAPVAAIERIARVRGAATPAADRVITDRVIAAASATSSFGISTASCATSAGSVSTAASATADNGRSTAASAAAGDRRSTAATTSTAAATVSRPVASIGAAGVTTEDRQADPPPGDTMTLTEHLGELRARIIRSALAITIGMVLVVAFYDQVLGFLLEPYQELCARKPRDFCSAELFNFTPTEGLTTRLRVGMYGGIILALPVILWQVWRFIVPALNPKEKKYAIPFIVSSVFLFSSMDTLAKLVLKTYPLPPLIWARYSVHFVFMLVLFVLEPLFLHRWFSERVRHHPESTFTLVTRLHWVLLGMSLVTVAGAVAGSHGYLPFARCWVCRLRVG